MEVNGGQGLEMIGNDLMRLVWFGTMHSQSRFFLHLQLEDSFQEEIIL